MTATAPAHRLRWLAGLPTRMLAGWLLFAVLVGGAPAVEVAPESTAQRGSASAQHSPDSELEAEQVDSAETGPAVAVTVVWQPVERRRSSTLPARLVERGPPRG